MEIIKTADGSHTLFIPEINEHYHSVNGAFGESMHVYINAGFNYCEKQNINVFEVGFGTGLNAFLTFKEAEKKKKTVYYQSVELFPLEKEIFQKLNYPAENTYEKDIFLKLHEIPWGNKVEISNDFILHKIKGDLTHLISIDNCDLIYFDAFAPEKQPELWQQPIFDYLFEKLNHEGVLTTYCAKGELKRRLKKAGFCLDSLQGFNGKREMTRAIKH